MSHKLDQMTQGHQMTPIINPVDKIIDQTSQHNEAMH